MTYTAALVISGMSPISLTGCLFDDRALKTTNEDFVEECRWERQCNEQGWMHRSAEACVLGDWEYLDEDDTASTTDELVHLNSVGVTRRCI